eukprot:768276-Hanusia_phi.AAC.1
MPQGSLKSKKPQVVNKLKKATATKKGQKAFKCKKQTFSDKLNKKLTAEISNKIEREIAGKFSKSGGKLSIIKNT